MDGSWRAAKLSANLIRSPVLGLKCRGRSVGRAFYATLRFSEMLLSRKAWESPHLCYPSYLTICFP